MIRKMKKWFPILVLVTTAIIVSIITMEITIPHVSMTYLTALVLIDLELLNICEKYKIGMALIWALLIILCICFLYSTGLEDVVVFVVCVAICCKLIFTQGHYIRKDEKT